MNWYEIWFAWYFYNHLSTSSEPALTVTSDSCSLLMWLSAVVNMHLKIWCVIHCERFSAHRGCKERIFVLLISSNQPVPWVLILTRHFWLPLTRFFSSTSFSAVSQIWQKQPCLEHLRFATCHLVTFSTSYSMFDLVLDPDITWNFVWIYVLHYSHMIGWLDNYIKELYSLFILKLSEVSGLTSPVND